MMADYKKYLEKIKGDTLLIVAEAPMLPLVGIASIVDWRINSLLSKLILDESYTTEDGSVLLLNSKNKMPVEKTIVIGFNNKLASKLFEITKGLRSKNFCVSYNNKNKKDKEPLKNIANDLKNIGLKWESSGFHQFENETIITFTGVKYE